MAELLAIEEALDSIKNKDTKYIIYTDSEYSIKSVTVWLPAWKRNNWRTTSRKPIENKELLIRIFEKLQEQTNTKIDWVKAHQKKD